MVSRDFSRIIYEIEIDLDSLNFMTKPDRIESVLIWASEAHGGTVEMSGQSGILAFEDGTWIRVSRQTEGYVIEVSHEEKDSR